MPDVTTASFDDAKKRLGVVVYGAIFARVEIFTLEWREVQTDVDLRHWGLETQRGALEGCGIKYFRHVQNSVHYRVAYRQVREPTPRLVFIDAYKKEAEDEAIARIRRFARQRGYC